MTINAPRFRKFAKCSIFEDFCQAIKEERRSHINFIACERLDKKKKRDKAKQDPGRFLSLIIDGADQSDFGLPHIPVKTKSQTGYVMKVRQIGSLQRAVKNKLLLLRMMEDFESGANHII